jgi:hypothetical protein
MFPLSTVSCIFILYMKMVCFTITALLTPKQNFDSFCSPKLFNLGQFTPNENILFPSPCSNTDILLYHKVCWHLSFCKFAPATEHVHGKDKSLGGDFFLTTVTLNFIMAATKLQYSGFIRWCFLLIFEEFELGDRGVLLATG